MATKTKQTDTLPIEDTSQSDLQQALNDPVTVPAFGRKYEIKHFTMGPLIRALPHLSPLAYVFRSWDAADFTQTIVTALHVAGEPALGLISVATSEPMEWLEEQDPLDGLDLLTAIVDKNAKYFFYPANVERMKAAFARLQSTMQAHGGATSTS